MRGPAGTGWIVALGLLAGCSVTTQTYERSFSDRVHQLRLPISNVYAIESDEGAILVDSGDPGQAEDIVRAMRDSELDPARVQLVVVTHAHADHIGSAAALHRALDVPIALQRADVTTASTGHNPPLTPTSLTAELLTGFLTQDFEPLTPDVAFDDCLDLTPFGVRGVVRSTPGHTPGSSVILLDSGDAFVGDLIAGGYLGGMIAAHVPTEHYYQDRPAQIRAILAWLLDQGVRRLFLGHGGPVTAEAARTALEGGDLGERRDDDPVFDPGPCPEDAAP